MSNDPNITCPPGNIFIKPIDKPKTEGGITRPDSDQQKSQEGLVLAVGVATKEMDPPCQVGQTVIFKQWTGTEYKHGRDTYIFLSFSDIRGILNG